MRDFRSLRRYDRRMYRLRNEVMNYAWGSRAAIAHLQGRAASDQPEAELWMGAHPKAPSSVEIEGRWEPLADLIANAPEMWVGPLIAQQFGGTLPFLFKVLAAETPLSLQAHPSLEQARAGFDTENAKGVPLDAAHRNYRDRNHKPELLCALTPFEALCGFRSRDAAASLFDELAVPSLTSAAAPLWDEALTDEQAMRATFAGLMRLPREIQQQLSQATVEALPVSDSPFVSSYEWARRLAALYPGDIGVVSSLLLNQVTLQPGQALFLPAGNLHAYLKGVGVELMANSDNVLRGGCTPKHVDVEELLSVLSFRAGPIPIVLPSPADGPVRRYVTDAAEFELTQVEVRASLELPKETTPRILLVVEGGPVRCTSGNRELVLARGQSAYLTPGDDAVSLSGNATCFSAGVGKPHS